jgi:hypothetical protein
MKTIAYVLLAAIVIVGCKKSEISELPPLTSPGVMAKIGGNSITYGVPFAERQVSTDGTETIFLSASSTDGNSIEISLSKPGGITSGSYDASNAAFIGISDGNNYYATGNTVSIKIISNDGTKVIGSFSGTAQDATSGTSASIAEGRFYAEY